MKGRGTQIRSKNPVRFRPSGFILYTCLLTTIKWQPPQPLNIQGNQNWILPSRIVSLPQCRASGAHGIIQRYLNSIGIDRQFRILHKSNAHANIAQERPLLKLGNLVSVLQCFRCDPLTPCDAAIC